MTSTVHYVDRHGRVTCLRRRHDSESASIGPVTEWPEYVTCAGACATAAKADLIIADRERAAWTRPREIRDVPLGAEVRLNADGTLAMIALDLVPAVLTLEDLDRLEQLVARARERAQLLLARQRHRQRYAKPGAPPDPEHCQHHGMRKSSSGRLVCWTCAGEWDATTEGIAQAAAASTGAQA